MNEGKKTITLWAGEGVLEFLKDKNCLVLTTQLYKTKTKNQHVKLTIEVKTHETNC